MKDDELIQKAKDRYKIACDVDASEAELAHDDLLFEHNEDNHQWPHEVKLQRESDIPPRPCLSLNKISEKLDLVEGEFRQLRPSVKVRAVDSIADPKIAEIRAGILRHIEYSSMARAAYNTAHSSTLRCGRGAWRIDIEENLEDPFERDVVINRIPNVFTVKIDPKSKKQDRSDAKYVFLSEKIPIDEFEAEYPDASTDGWPDELFDADWKTEKEIRVVEYWWKEDVEKTFYRIRKGIEGFSNEYTVSEDKMSDDDFEYVIAEKKTKIPQVKWCKLNAMEVLEGPHDYPSKYIPIVFEVGKEKNIGGNTKLQGMVRPAKTPQQMYNYWSSAITEQIALVPKSPFLVTAGMIGPHQGMWDMANIKSFPYLLFDVDPAAPNLAPRREPPPQISPAIAHELMRMEHDIMSAMGLYSASLGDEGEEKSGKAIIARQRQGSLGSYIYTDNFQVALVYSTKVIMDLIPHVYNTERIVRILGIDGGEKAVPINMRPQSPLMHQIQGLSGDYLSAPREGVTSYINDLSVGQYDIVVSIGPSYDTQRQEALTMLLDLAGKIPEFGKATIDLIVKNIDVPGVDELLKRAKKLVPIGIRDPEPGEKMPQKPGPTPEQIIEERKLQLAYIEEMRKGFEAKMDAIAKIMTAESKERGRQFDEVKSVIDSMQQQSSINRGQ